MNHFVRQLGYWVASIQLMSYVIHHLFNHLKQTSLILFTVSLIHSLGAFFLWLFFRIILIAEKKKKRNYSSVFEDST